MPRAIAVMLALGGIGLTVVARTIGPGVETAKGYLNPVARKRAVTTSAFP